MSVFLEKLLARYQPRALIVVDGLAAIVMALALAMVVLAKNPVNVPPALMPRETGDIKVGSVLVTLGVALASYALVVFVTSVVALLALSFIRWPFKIGPWAVALYVLFLSPNARLVRALFGGLLASLVLHR